MRKGSLPSKINNHGMAHSTKKLLKFNSNQIQKAKIEERETWKAYWAKHW